MNSPFSAKLNIVSVVTLLCLIHFSSAVRMLREENYLGAKMENDGVFKEEKDTPNIGGFPFPFNFPPFSSGIPNIPFNIPGMSIPGTGDNNNPFSIPIPGVPGVDNPVPGLRGVANPIPEIPGAANPDPEVSDVANPITGVPEVAVAPPTPAP
ncbi:hypothetical protein BC332_04002 [Capsicum chinense]|nr:hypothetical protein BC332_04002 [Capsicum chinense]